MNSGYTSRGFESFDRDVDALCCCNAFTDVASSAVKMDASLKSAVAAIDSFTYKDDVVSKFDLLTDAITRINTRITSLDREIEKIKKIKKQKMNSNFNFNFVSFKKEELKTLNQKGNLNFEIEL